MLLYVVYDFTSSRCWKGALQLKEMMPRLSAMKTAVFMTVCQPHHYTQATRLAQELALPFPLLKPTSFTQIPFSLRHHGDNAVFIFDRAGRIRHQIIKQAPDCAVNYRQIFACLQQMHLPCAQTSTQPLFANRCLALT